MKTLVSVLAILWFLGWGYWFLYERGHIAATGFQTKELTGKSENLPSDTMDAMTEEEEKEGLPFFRHHPSPDSAGRIIDRFLEQRTEGEAVQVVAYYSESEIYEGTEGNPGIERSDALVREASVKFGPAELQTLGLKAHPNEDTIGIGQYYKVEKVKKDNPVRLIDDGRILIFFPYASDIELDSSEITHTLDSLSNIWRDKDIRLTVSGHTDNDASETTNYRLGMDRALSIQKKLTSSGIPESKITILSRGEKEPISTNTTREGRYLNRRVEILLHK